MDAYFDIVSMRRHGEYAPRPVPREALIRILEAARASGSSQNRQPWHFYAVTSRDLLNRMATCVYEHDNLTGCQAAIAIVMAKAGLDTGRCAQNIMLAAWADGIASAPNGIKDGDALRRILELEGDNGVAMIVSLGYPVRTPRQGGDPAGVLRRIKRKPLEELVTWRE